MISAASLQNVKHLLTLLQESKHNVQTQRARRRSVTKHNEHGDGALQNIASMVMERHQTQRAELRNVTKYSKHGDGASPNTTSNVTEHHTNKILMR